MSLNQFQITYQAAEDRILLRATFREDSDKLQEIRAWLTRRMVRNLWPKLLESLEAQVTLDNPGAAQARSLIVGMDHQASVAAIEQGGRFGVPFQPAENDFPLGETPIVITRAKFSMAAGQPVQIELSPEDGNGFQMGLTTELLHGFCRLLQQAVANSDWDFELQRPWDEDLVEDGPRVLN